MSYRHLLAIFDKLFEWIRSYAEQPYRLQSNSEELKLIHSLVLHLYATITRLLWVYDQQVPTLDTLIDDKFRQITVYLNKYFQPRNHHTVIPPQQ